MLSITHPNNPTGCVLTEAELRELCAFCKEKDIYLLSDGKSLPAAAPLPVPPPPLLLIAAPVVCESRTATAQKALF